MKGGYISVEAVYGVLGDTFLKWDIWWRAFHRGLYRFSSFLLFFHIINYLLGFSAGSGDTQILNINNDISQLPNVFRRISWLLIQGFAPMVQWLIRKNVLPWGWFLFDYREAFDLIDHSILVTNWNRLTFLTVSSIGLSTSFQTGSRESNSARTVCLSKVKYHLERPQGPSLALGFFSPPHDNDLSVHSTFNMWKYVDDNTVSVTIPEGQQSKAHDTVMI